MPLCNNCSKVETEYKCLMCHRHTCDGCSEFPGNGNIHENVRYCEKRKCYISRLTW